VNYKGNQPTAWKTVLDGEIGIGLVLGAFWLAVALAFGAFIATVVGVVTQLLSKSK